MKLTKRLFAILLAAAMVFSILPVVAMAAGAVTDPIVTTASFSNPWWSDQGNCTFTIGSADYQPHFYFSQAGIDRMQAYAAENEVDTLRIYAEFTGSNSLVLNNAAWIGQGETGRYLDVPIADMSTSFDIWSQSDIGTSITLRFEAFRAPIVTTASFSNPWWSDQGNCTFSIGSAEYQPHFYFSQAGIDRMQAYAAKWGVDTLRIYGEFTGSNSLVLNNQAWIGPGVTGQYLDVPIADMSTSFDIWSQSDIGTSITLRFEAFRAPIVTTASFANPWWSDQGNCTFYIGSAEYQPHFYFSQAGIDRMQAYASAWDVDTLRIYGEFTGSNCLVLNNACWIAQGVTGQYLDVPIANMSTSFDIWSQSDIGTTITLRFVPYKAPVVKPAYFTGSGGFSNDTDGTITFASADYQPHYYFTAAGISAIQSYAAANGYDVLRITASFTGTNNCLVINNQAWIGSEPYSLDVPIANLSTSFDFWSQSEGITNVTMSFEFLHPSHTWVVSETIPATCTAAGSTEYECSVCGATDTQTVGALGHDLVHHEAQAATCTAIGWAAYDTCSRCDYTTYAVIPALGHDYVNGYCTRCGVGDGTDASFKIVSAKLTISKDIVVTYTCAVPETLTDPYMIFTFNGSDYRVEPSGTDASGRYLFRFEGVTPEKMNDNICSTLYATNASDETVHVTKDTYSVRTYCVNTMGKYPGVEKLQTLLADLLAYGAAAQNYTGYRTGALVTEGINMEYASAFTDLTQTKLARTGTTDENVGWVSATLQCGSQMAMVFTFYTDDLQATTAEVTINGRTTTYAATDVAGAGSGKYTATFDGISATEFDDTVTAILKKDGVQVGETLTYSVNSYVYSMQNNESVPYLANLVKAIYNYGASAKAYVG